MLGKLAILVLFCLVLATFSTPEAMPVNYDLIRCDALQVFDDADFDTDSYVSDSSDSIDTSSRWSFTSVEDADSSSPNFPAFLVISVTSIVISF